MRIRRLTFGAVALLAVLAGSVSASNHTLDDFQYVMTVGVDNQSGSTLSTTPIAVQMQPDNLTPDFLQADADDWRPTDLAGTALTGVAQSMTTGPNTWWVNIPAQGNGAVAAYDFHMGNTTATRDQTFRVDGTTDTITADDHAELDITDDVVVRATATLLAWPSAETDVVQKDDNYSLSVDQSGGVERALFRVWLPTADASPDSDVTIGDFALTGCAVNWQCIDEYPADDSGTTTLDETGTGEEIFGLANTTNQTADVDTVTVNVRALNTLGDGTIRLAICTAACASRTNGATQVLTSGWTNYTEVFTTAPGGGAWSDMSSLNTLEIPIQMVATTGTSRVTQMYISVLFSDAAYASDDDAAAGLVTGTEYVLEGRYDNNLGSDNIQMYVNSSQRGTQSITGTLSTSANSLVAGGSVNGWVEDVRIGTTDITAPTWVLQWDFEPDEVAETQQGNSGNSWTWTGTVEDTSAGGSDHDGTYSLTRDMTGITTWTFNLSPNPPKEGVGSVS